MLPLRTLFLTLALIHSFGALAQTSSTTIRPPTKEQTEADNACAMAAAYAQMKAPEAEVKQHIPLCSRNSNRQICDVTLKMIKEARSTDMGLVCHGIAREVSQDRAPLTTVPHSNEQEKSDSACAMAAA